MVFHNITGLFGDQYITKECFDWCKEANFIHETNLQIENLSLVIIALFSLLANHLIHSNYDWLVKEIKIKEAHIQMLYIASNYFAFFILLVFLIFQIVKY